MKVLVLAGGISNERDVSLRSAASVIKALEANGYSVAAFDPINGLENLTSYVGKVDVVLPILHGTGGEDGAIQAQLEKLGFKYLGADSKVSRLCFNKVHFKKVVQDLGVLTPAGEEVTLEIITNSPLLAKPYVLKPISGGSSIDTLIIHEPKEEVNFKPLLQKYGKMLLEELITGMEITVSVLGNKALPVIEIIPPEGKDFDFENKYNGATTEACPPINVSQELQLKVQQIAESIHVKLGIRHLSRTDMIITPDEKVYVLETNTIPGLTDQSLFPKAAATTGLPMPRLVQKFIELTLAAD